MTHAKHEEGGEEQEVGLEQAEEIGHLAHENLATAKNLFTLSLSQIFDCLTMVLVLNL